jgi:hypothetical protein
MYWVVDVTRGSKTIAGGGEEEEEEGEELILSPREVRRPQHTSVDWTKEEGGGQERKRLGREQSEELMLSPQEVPPRLIHLLLSHRSSFFITELHSVILLFDFF